MDLKYLNNLFALFAKRFQLTLAIKRKGPRLCRRTALRFT